MNKSNIFKPFDYFNDRHHIILNSNSDSDIVINDTSEIEYVYSNEDNSFEYIPFDNENQIILLNQESSESDFKEIEDIKIYSDDDIPYLLSNQNQNENENESVNSKTQEIKVEDYYSIQDYIIPIKLESPINKNTHKNLDIEITIDINEDSFHSENSKNSKNSEDSENLSQIIFIDLSKDDNSSNKYKLI